MQQSLESLREVGCKLPAEVLPAIVGNRQSSEMIILVVYWDKIVSDSDKVEASLSRVVEGLEAGSNKLWPIV